jgi:Cu+-exporting ATPase
MLFKQQPQDKLDYIKNLKKRGQSVVMVGDGLNDAGALKESTVGIAVTEDIAVFTPASDAILDASVFEKLDQFISISKSGIKVIRTSLLISLFYNLIGISIAVMGILKPVYAAILMPISSISVVIFTTIASKWISRKL